MTDYELDDEGYTKIIFVDKNDENEEDEEEDENDEEREDDEGYPVIQFLNKFGEIEDDENDFPTPSDEEKKNVLLDDEGYPVIQFLNKFGEIEDDDFSAPLNEITEVYSSLYDSADDFSIPPQHIMLAKSGRLTKDALLDMEYSEVLRLATYEPAKEIIGKLIGVRGVYLKNKHRSSDGTFVPTTIKPHQVKAITWMKQREESSIVKTRGVRGGILRLKMGLGKTLTSAILILSSQKGKFPSLIVCSKTVMINWKRDGFEKFFCNDERKPKVLYLHKDFMSQKEINNVDRNMILKYDIVVTSYDACLQACKKQNYQEQCFEMGDEHTLMKGKIVSVHERKLQQADLPSVTGLEVIYGTPWERVICDESQTFANPDTQRYKCIMAIYGKYKWCLTGTPIRNKETDIWAQLRFCGYNGVTIKNEWKKKGDKIFKEHNLVEAIFSMDYKDAGQKLPPKTKHLINIKLTGKQKEAYEFILGETRNVYDKMMQNLCSFSCVLAMFTRLRQCAIAPYLITAESKREKTKGKAAKGDKEAIGIIEDMLTGKSTNDLGKWCHDKDGEAGIYSAKMSKLIETISKIPKDKKVIIFSMFTSCLDLLAYALEVRIPEFGFVQIDGDTVGEERERLLNQFDKDPNIRGALFTYKVGGEGINLIVANHCICIEPWWTPAVPAQAESRCWRMGQTQPVHVHDVIVDESIEDRIIAICNEKDAMAASYLDGTERPMEKLGLNKYALGQMLGIRR